MIDLDRARPILEAMFAEHAALGRLPSLAWGLVEAGGLRAAREEGVVYRIASMTKSFTCAAILMLRDEGHLALDDPIARHAPEMAHLRGPTGDAPPITIRHLMTMSGGLATDDPWADRHLDVADAALDRWLAPGAAFAEAPGMRFEYSNLGFGLLGRVVRRITGAPLQKPVTERLLAPLGMTRTTWTAPPDAVTGYGRRGDEADPRAASGRWRHRPDGRPLHHGGRPRAPGIAFLADAFPPRDGPDPAPLSRASRREMQQAQRAFPPRTVTARDGRVRTVTGGYGYGLNVTWVDPIGWVVDHSGGLPGFGSTCGGPAGRRPGGPVQPQTYARTADATAAALMALHAGEVLRPVVPSVTAALRLAAQQLVTLHNAWDDRVAETLFADNVDLDEERERRAAAAARLAAEHGPFTTARVEARSATSGVAVAHGTSRGAAHRLPAPPSPASPRAALRDQGDDMRARAELARGSRRLLREGTNTRSIPRPPRMPTGAEDRHGQDCCIARAGRRGHPRRRDGRHRRLRRRAPLRDEPDLALRDKGTKNLTLVCNSLGDPGATRGQILAENKQVKKLIAAFSVRPGTPTASEEQIAAGTMEVELVPQGILVERCRAGGAGIPAFYSPTSVGTDLAKGREIREFDGKPYVLEHAIHVDYALLQRLSRGPPRQRPVPRRQPELQSELRQGGAGARSSRWTRSWSPARSRPS